MTKTDNKNSAFNLFLIKVDNSFYNNKNPDYLSFAKDEVKNLYEEHVINHTKEESFFEAKAKENHQNKGIEEQNLSNITIFVKKEHYQRKSLNQWQKYLSISKNKYALFSPQLIDVVEEILSHQDFCSKEKEVQKGKELLLRLKSVIPVFQTEKEQEVKNDILLPPESALVFIKGKKYLFVITFGKGFNDLKESVIEPHFGKTMIKKIVDPDQIKTMDIFSVQGYGKKQNSFKVQKSQNFISEEESYDSSLKEIKGKIKTNFFNEKQDPILSEYLNGFVSGKESFKFTSKIPLDQLSVLIENIYNIYEDNNQYQV